MDASAVNSVLGLQLNQICNFSFLDKANKIFKYSHTADQALQDCII